MRPDPVIVQVAARIRQARLDAGMSQTALAAKTGLDLRTVTRIEGVDREPSISTVIRLARGLDQSVSELLAGIE